jgi:hypothetical protein
MGKTDKTAPPVVQGRLVAEHDHSTHPCDLPPEPQNESQWRLQVRSGHCSWWLDAWTVAWRRPPKRTRFGVDPRRAQRDRRWLAKVELLDDGEFDDGPLWPAEDPA